MLECLRSLFNRFVTWLASLVSRQDELKILCCDLSYLRGQDGAVLPFELIYCVPKHTHKTGKFPAIAGSMTNSVSFSLAFTTPKLPQVFAFLWNFSWSYLSSLSAGEISQQLAPSYMPLHLVILPYTYVCNELVTILSVCQGLSHNFSCGGHTVSKWGYLPDFHLDNLFTTCCRLFA